MWIRHPDASLRHPGASLAILAKASVIPAKASAIPAQASVIRAKASVIPAQAGIYTLQWTPVFAGATGPHPNHPKGNTARPPDIVKQARTGFTPPNAGILNLIRYMVYNRIIRLREV